MLKKCFILIMSVVLSVTLLFANGCAFIDHNSKNSEIETPGDETPGDETPGDETPGVETPGGETPGDETPGGETPGDETPGDETPGDDLEQIIPGDHNYGIGELPLN